jgi:hypothetical protein
MISFSEFGLEHIQKGIALLMLMISVLTLNLVLINLLIAIMASAYAEQAPCPHQNTHTHLCLYSQGNGEAVGPGGFSRCGSLHSQDLCYYYFFTHLSIYSSTYLHRVMAKLLNQVESADVDPSILKAFMRTPAVESMAGILCI